MFEIKTINSFQTQVFLSSKLYMFDYSHVQYIWCFILISFVDPISIFWMLGVLKTIAQSFISEVEDKFNLEGKISSFETHGNGNVNDTFLLFCQDGERMNRYTLQRINHMVFKNPEGLMENFSRVTNHLKSKISNVGPEQQCLSLISVSYTHLTLPTTPYV